MKNVIAIFAFLLASSFLSSQELNQNIKNFSQLPDVYDVKISPNGKMVGVLREIDQERMVSIIDLESRKLLHTHRFNRKRLMVVNSLRFKRIPATNGDFSFLGINRIDNRSVSDGLVIDQKYR